MDGIFDAIDDLQIIVNLTWMGIILEMIVILI